MNNRDTKLMAWVDIPAALGLLTRLPIPVNTERAVARGAAAVWAYPIAGIVIGAMLAATAQFCVWLGLPDGIVAGLLLAVSAILTGAMHEDGLADSADGLWGGWDRDRRLAIMKDSHIGVYGVMAICLSLLLRWMALVYIVAASVYWPVLICAAVVSRTNMVVLMAILPHARTSGLSHSVGRPKTAPSVLAVLLTILVILYCHAFSLLWVAAIVAFICGAIAKAKIGGQTGDILGATQQITEIALLLFIIVKLS